MAGGGTNATSGRVGGTRGAAGVIGLMRHDVQVAVDLDAASPTESSK